MSTLCGDLRWLLWLRLSECRVVLPQLPPDCGQRETLSWRAQLSPLRS